MKRELDNSVRYIHGETGAQRVHTSTTESGMPNDSPKRRPQIKVSIFQNTQHSVKKVTSEGFKKIYWNQNIERITTKNKKTLIL